MIAFYLQRFYGGLQSFGATFFDFSKKKNHPKSMRIVDTDQNVTVVDKRFILGASFSGWPSREMFK